MNKKVHKNVKGIVDLLPASAAKYSAISSFIALRAASFSFKEIVLPMLEYSEVFKRAIGSDTDVVNKEMYLFKDRNDDELCLRPEGTASLVRAGIQHGLFYNAKPKYYYYGPMFRYERPQKGRNRQFFQFGMESFGWDNVFDELQQIVMLDQIFRDLEISEFELQLNSIGQLEERIKYKDALIKFLLPYKSELDEDSIKRLDTNPLRIFDSKVAQTIEIMRDAPLLCDYFSDPTKKRFDLLCEQLTKLNVKFNLNSGLVRGLDYYNDTVFEFTSGSLGAQATFCAGGRYDSLVSQMGGEEVPASGFAIGIDRLAMLTNYGEQEPSLDVVFIVLGNIEDSYVLFLQNSLSTYGLTSSIIFSNGKLKSQLSKANKLGAKISMIINDEEFLNNSVIIKPMLIDLEQVRADYVSCIEQTVKILRG